LSYIDVNNVRIFNFKSRKNLRYLC